MGYPCQVFHASELPERVQSNLSGRKRKLDRGAKSVDLFGCELVEMLQYKCEIKEPIKWDSPVQCFAVERLFRKLVRCQDKKGSFMVETTAWEGKDYPLVGQKSDNGEDKAPPQHYHWSSSWHAPDTTR
ncbi:hypothetical protein F53441_8866 [Fusarium austroafricanum]|uniref:Uncharacterized protein n=1 Tax=Fusarium austroafricanum TaxID=2364996 RepID=A0A8H4KEL0_9HYPO|nr:hypothetical protein F53441_8866 [Fusarium austroafricanum]